MEVYFPECESISVYKTESSDTDYTGQSRSSTGVAKQSASYQLDCSDLFWNSGESSLHPVELVKLALDLFLTIIPSIVIIHL